MLKTVVKIIKNIKLNNDKPLMLGRWNHGCKKSQAIKALHASHDSCGGKMCGTPKLLKELKVNM